MSWVLTLTDRNFKHIEEKLHFYSKVEGKNQESIQPSTTPDQGQRMGKRQITNHIQGSQEISPFPVGDNKAARRRKDNMAKTKTKFKKNVEFSKYI